MSAPDSCAASGLEGAQRADASVAAPAKVWLVGAGPGAADLLTLRAARLLAEADVVLHDALVDEAVLALASHARKVAVGKRACRPSTAQRFINKQIVDAARAHRTVVRLKGGDPLLFGRAEEEIEALEAAGIAWEVVPGVTAACAAAAALGRSLTRRGVSRSVSFVTPAVGEGEAANTGWIHAARGSDTAVIYMGGRQIRAIAAALVEAGMEASTPIAAIASASLAAEQMWRGTLQQAIGRDAVVPDGPVILLVGPVVEPRPAVAQEALQYLEKPGAAHGSGEAASRRRAA